MHITIFHRKEICLFHVLSNNPIYNELFCTTIEFPSIRCLGGGGGEGGGGGGGGGAGGGRGGGGGAGGGGGGDELTI